MHAHLPIKYPFYDVIVVGARCAGASTAMLLARAGLRVLVIDRQLYGSDTLSTHALMRPAVVQLARWGLLEKIVAESTPVITATSFHYGGDDVVTIPVQGNAGIPGLVAPRRTVLDRLLVDAAIEAGAEVVHGVVAQELLHHRTGRVSGVRVRCADGRVLSLNASWVVGADGLGSLVGREANARTLYRGRASAATTYVYTKNPGVDGYHWYFGERCAAGIIPTNEDKVCVFASTPAKETDPPTHVSMTERHNAVLRQLIPSIAEHIAFTGCSMPRGFRGVPAPFDKRTGQVGCSSAMLVCFEILSHPMASLMPCATLKELRGRSSRHPNVSCRSMSKSGIPLLVMSYTRLNRFAASTGAKIN